MADDDDTVLRAPRRVDSRIARGTDDVDDTVLSPGRSRPVRSPGAPAGHDREPAERVPAVRIGDTVHPLVVPVIVGRNPAPNRIERGPEPSLVPVRSRSGEVSSTHVRLWAEGPAVVVADQRSTNGTIVREPGRPPRRLPSGGTIVVLTGTVVDIGDGNLIEILSPRLHIAPGAPHTGPGPNVGIPPAAGLHH